MTVIALGFDLIIRLFIVTIMFIPETLDVGFVKAGVGAKDFMLAWWKQCK